MLVGHVVQATELVTVEKEPRVVVGEGVRMIETTAFFRDQLPEVKILLRAAHLFRLATSGIGERKEIEQPVVHEP